MHPSETIQLEGIGPHVAGLLTDKLKAYCQENGLPMPPPPVQGKN
jgi:crossover junction endonuclease MUS81